MELLCVCCTCTSLPGTCLLLLLNVHISDDFAIYNDTQKSKCNKARAWTHVLS